MEIYQGVVRFNKQTNKQQKKRELVNLNFRQTINTFGNDYVANIA